MQLAKVPGIDNHLHFGKERLLLLAAATKGAGGVDPIGDFLAKYNLGFDPAEEIDLDAYKDAVDLAEGVRIVTRLLPEGRSLEPDSPIELVITHHPDGYHYAARAGHPG